jgi:hypothetical protein
MVLQALAEADKSIAFFPGWSNADQNDAYTHFLAPLSIAGIAEAGLFLSGGAYANQPDRHVTFELAIDTAGAARRVRLMRLDWRSLRGGHSNQRRANCPPECYGRRVSDTHFHAFDLNWMEIEGRMRSPKLPCARDIPEQLQSFEAVRSFVGKHFRINNIDVVSPPEWVYDLFPNDSGNIHDD